MDYQRGSQAQHDRGVIVAGVAVGNITTNGAAIAHLGIGNQARRLDQQRAVLGQQRRPDQVVLGRHGTDTDLVAFQADTLE